MLFHPIAGRWRPACLRAATASVETVSPPSEFPGYHPAPVASKTAPCGVTYDLQGRFLSTHSWFRPNSDALPKRSANNMSSLNISIRHQLSQDEALARIKKGIAHLKSQYSEHLSNLEENWNGNRGTFGFSAIGFPVSSTVVVNASDVAVDLALPFAALAFKGKIESTLRDMLTKLLA